VPTPENAESRVSAYFSGGVSAGRWLASGAMFSRRRACVAADSSTRRRLVDQHIAGTRDHDSALWTLLVFELWRLEYLGADPTL